MSAKKNQWMRLMLVLIALAAQHAAAQNEWRLQPWLQVVGMVQGKQLGYSVGYLGKWQDTTRISVSTYHLVSGQYVYDTRVFFLKSPQDTTPRLFYSGGPTTTGDFNGDGIKDLVVGGDPTRIYLGNSSGVFEAATSFEKYSEESYDEFGRAVAVGRVDGDAFDDLIISAMHNNLYRGKVYVFLGGAQMDTLPHWSVQGDYSDAFLGWNVTAGDLNSDGYDDVIVRGYDQNPQVPGRFAYIRVYLGGNLMDTTSWYSLRGGDVGSYSLASFDTNGDGIEDLLWTNVDSVGTAYEVFIHFGGAQLDTIPNIKLRDPGYGDFGISIANAGDMNGDGYDEVAVGALGTFNFGMVFVFSGGPWIDGKFDAAAGLSVPTEFGKSIAGIGDVNGDGLADILVGAPRYEWEEYRGYWAILLGDSRIPTSVSWDEFSTPQKVFILQQNYPNPFNASTKIRYALAERSSVRLEITDMLGRTVMEVDEGERPAGEYAVTFDARDFSSGVYFCTLTVHSDGQVFSRTMNMLLIR